MVASFSNAAAFSTATSRVTSVLKDPTLISGDYTSGTETFDVIDPGATNAQFEDGSAVIAHVRRMGRDDTKAAIDRAHKALPLWRDKTTAVYRSGILSKWSSLIKESAEVSFLLPFSLIFLCLMWTLKLLATSISLGYCQNHDF